MAQIDEIPQQTLNDKIVIEHYYKYKMTLCKQYESKVQCQKGLRCQQAHSKDQLRQQGESIAAYFERLNCNPSEYLLPEKTAKRAIIRTKSSEKLKNKKQEKAEKTQLIKPKEPKET